MKSALLSLALLCAVPLSAVAEGWPREIAQPHGPLTLQSAPVRVVSTAPSLTGILLAIDAPLIATGAAVKGTLTDDHGFFTQWSRLAHERGVQQLYPNLQFDLESLIASDPDLVVVSASGGDSILPHVADLSSLGLSVLVVDYSTHSWEEQARILGRATGREAEADSVIADFTARLQAAKEKLAGLDGSASIVSYNFAGTYSVGKPSSTQGKLLTQLGFRLEGLPRSMAGAVTRSGDFDFVSLENLPAAITGDRVFLLSGTPETVEAFKADPVLATLPAVRSGQVYPLGPTSFRIDYYSGLALIDTVLQAFPGK